MSVSSYQTVQEHQPAFIALHLQEFGGKNYQVNMGSAECFIRTLIQSEEMSQYDWVRAFIDNDFTQPDSFTALGSVYFIHSSLRTVQIYDFKDRKFIPLSGQTVCMGSLEDCHIVHKERFPQDFWPEFPWTRKGFMTTRWLVHNRMFDLVNLHLFHDASNLLSSDCSPSLFSSNRRRALTHVLTRLQDSCACNAPFFLFGDFNFRLDLKSLIQAQGWSPSVTGETGKQTVVYEQDGEVQLVMKCKRFEHKNVKIFQDDSEHMLLRFDHEPVPFLNELTEVQISFPPTYPFSENVTEPEEFLSTRCPAWCDRVLMSHPAQALLQKAKEGENCIKYQRIGGDVCMGDHKPVYLYFQMESALE
ncbi:PREDICTED: type I inositol 1,4,5-trisphosphate 5-phosphatase-like [Nanorana parkeri]|uniref:type I inositol 1,4,5-trisphosphate 5-phosphatase-like n=1 Tax=Nanorana parkeri TaxID=125878 RepID=UPI0008542C34|nr:PREDICTED: type I inositol 1,4,5-trisphosphate 5-phosphatase-like [Nanorana parkeri]